MHFLLVSFCLLFALTPAFAQDVVIKPDRVFDGTTLHTRWVVVVSGSTISAVGPEEQIRIPPEAEVIDLPGMTLCPGLIEGHSHLLLHPYDEAAWNDQVVKESRSWPPGVTVRRAFVSISTCLSERSLPTPVI